MKKTLLTLTAVIALAGCSKQEPAEENSRFQKQNAIDFSTYVSSSAQTRASVIDDDYIKVNGFGVNAYYTTGADFDVSASYTGDEIFMDNTKVTYNEEKTAWTYSPVKYWPNNTTDKLSFFAYAPYKSEQISFFPKNKATLQFEVNNDVKKQVDLIYHKAGGDLEDAYATKTTNLPKPDVNSNILFKFQHALSRITFDVKAIVDETATDGDNILDGNTRINIKTVKLVGAENATANPFYLKGVLDLATGVWAPGEQRQSFTFDGDDFYRAVTENGNTYAQLTKFNPEQRLLSEDSYLMIIPQDFYNTDGYRIYIEYDVISEEVNNDAAENTTNDSNTITNKIYSGPLTTTFTAGQAYKFTLYLGMTSVKHTAEVADWSQENTAIEWVPVNTPVANN